MQPLVLLTTHVGKESSPQRRPLERVRIPLGALANLPHKPKNHVWWVERCGGSYYLRAKLFVKDAICTNEAGDQCVIWHLDRLRSERITWPRPKQGNKGKITNLTKLLLYSQTGGLMLVPISDNLDKEIADYCKSISEAVLRSELAIVLIHRLFHRVKLDISLADSSLSYEEACYFVHTYFAREELVSLPGYDAFEVVAIILAGYKAFPDNVNNQGQEIASGLSCESTEFHQLDEAYFARSESKRIEGNNTRLELSSISKKRHQYILKLLSRQLRARGFLPTYNCHIDMRIESRDAEVFFEVKTADVSSFPDQVRYGIGQLLEYKYRYKGMNRFKTIRLALVIEACVSSARYEFVRGFLANIGIVLVLWEPNTECFRGLDAVLS